MKNYKTKPSSEKAEHARLLLKMSVNFVDYRQPGQKMPIHVLSKKTEIMRSSSLILKFVLIKA